MLLTAMQDKPNQGIQAYGGTLLSGLLGDRGAFPACRDCLGGGQALLFPPVDVAFTISHLTSADAASPYK